MSRHLSFRVFSIVFLTAFILPLSGCGDDPEPEDKTIRSIRTVTVNEPASGKTRRFSGIVEASTVSLLSFEVGGNVSEVLAEVGQSIEQGQVMAILDSEPFLLNVDAATANADRAELLVIEAQRDLERYRSISHLITAQQVDQAQTAYDTARQNMSYAISRLNLAERDLDRTELRAPFDGTVTERQVEPFQEVRRGQPLFHVHAQGGMEAAIAIPESEIKAVYLGMSGMVRFPALGEESYEAIVTEVSQAAGENNSFPVKLTILANSTRIRAGLTAEVTLMLGSEVEEPGYLVPLAALVPGSGESPDSVFVYDPETSTVRQTVIEQGGIRDDNIVVKSGVQSGDIVASAGVSFLRDGQKVRLMQ